MSVSKRLNTATKALVAAGIPTLRGYPGTPIRVTTSPVAAISVERSDLKETVLAVWICSPASLGASVCEDAAQTAADVLRQKLAFCQVERCQYDGKSGLFSAKILASWKETLVNQVKLNRGVLVYATEFSAVQTRQVQQVTDPETEEKQVVNEEVIWTIAIQEQLPFREGLLVEDKEAFTLTVTHENYVETYPDCYWLSITLEENGGGLLRKRIARSWTERIVEQIETQ